jgi:hypothetical protein
MNDFKDLHRETQSAMRGMARAMLPFWIISGLFSLGALAGVIWFICWCLKSFGIVA